MSLAKFLSDEFFATLQSNLVSDQKWTDGVRSVKTSIMITVNDTGQSYLLSVEDGNTSLQKAAAGGTAEFSFDGAYEAWAKVGRGEVDLQSAVLKGFLRFRGSITKILLYRERFLRLAELMRAIPTEF